MRSRLGQIQFEGLKAPSGLQRTTGAAYAEHALFGRKPRLQMTGQELDQVELDIQLHLAFCDPAAEIRAMRKAMQAGTVLPFTLASGEFIGRFVITSLAEGWRKTDANGVLVSAALTLSLKEVSVDSPAKLVIETAQALATAVLTNNPVLAVRDNRDAVPDGGRDAMKKVSKAKTLSNKVREKAQQASRVIAEQAEFLRKAQAQAQEVKDNIDNARSIIVAGQTQIRNAERAIDKLEQAGQQALALRNASSLGDILTAVEAASSLTEAMQIAEQSCAGLASQVVTRQYP